MEPIAPLAHNAKYMWYFCGVVLLVISAIARLLAYPTATSDYTYFLVKWFDTLGSHPGLTAFLYPFSDYTPLYLYAIKLLTFIPVYSLFTIKMLTLLFDIGIAYGVALAVRAIKLYPQDVLFFIFSIVLCVPTLLINSSLWGQSDAVYALWVVFSLYFILRDKPAFAAIFFAIGISIKLQAIFFMPILVGYLWRKGEWRQLLWIPALYILSIIPAWMGGAPFFQSLFIYAHQSSEYTSLNVSSQSIFAFADAFSIPSVIQNVLFWVGAILALTVAGVIAWLVRKNAAPGTLVRLCLLCATIVPYLLPRMHERYFYLADIFSMLYAFTYPKEWFVPVIIVGASFLAYMPFLSGQVPLFAPLHVDLRIPSALLLLSIAYLATRFLQLRRHMAMEDR